MRKLIVILLVTLPFISFGQNKFGQLNISAGATYNLFRGVHKIPFITYDKSYQFTMGQQIHADWALMRRISIGAGITHQRHDLNIYNYTYTAGGENITENPVQSISVTGLYARGLYHMHKVYKKTNKMVDLYWGAQLQFIFYKSRNTSNDPDFHKTNKSLGKIPSLVGGIRFYPLKKLGVHAEVAIPGSYTLSMGITYRLSK